MAMTRGAIQVRGGGPRDGTKAQAQDVPPGYKRTEAGVIPVDWKIATFDRVCTRINGKSYQIYTDAYQVHGALPVVDQGQSHIVGYTDDEGRRFRCPAGGVIVFGDHTCVVKFVDHDFVVGADGTQIIATKPNHCARFHAFALQLRGIPPTGYNRHFKFLKERFFVCPGRPEQRAIAEALSDVDGLLGALDALIAKKRAIKQAAMQQLLTGKTRLPGFSGEWETKRLGEVGRCLRGVSYDPAADLASHDTATTVRLFRANNVEGDALSTADLQFVEKHKVTDSQLMRIDDVLVCTASGSKDVVGKAAQFRIDDGYQYTFGAFMGCYRPDREKANPTFAFYLFQTGRYRAHLSVTLAGSSINNLRPADIEAAEFRLPERAEQGAIATVLSDMDADIAALEARHDKTRQIKQGMMQQLLTGRVRLVKPEAAA
jgi:type I restriction enzyme S subunit